MMRFANSLAPPPVLVLPLLLASPVFSQARESVHAKERSVHGIPIQATAAVDDAYLEITAAIYEHMTSRQEPYDLRALHRKSGFRILLIHPEERFLDLPEYAGEDEELEEAGGLGGSIGEFHVAVRVGSPHALVHELGHGIYHSAIQFAETGGATDEEAWYAERVRALHGMDLEDAFEELGEDRVHEVLLASPGTFSSDLAKAWRNAVEKKLWEGEYAGTEPNEYWAEGVALWFRAWTLPEEDPRSFLAERDPMLHALCERIFPDEAWTPWDAHAASGGRVPFEDEDEQVSPDLAQLWKLLDRDGDGKLAPYEGAEAMLHLLQEAGEDQDGLELLELRAYLEEAHDEERRERDAFFRELDGDGDGFLTETEVPEDLDALLATADGDGDGRVSRREIQSADDLGDPRVGFELELLGFLEEVDADGDGAFALEDLPPGERAEFRQDFLRLDVDGNGLLTKTELLVLLEEELREASFQVQGTRAVMNGVIGASTPARVLQLLLEHPAVDTIVMQEVPGSIDDESNLRAARYVRRFGLATHLPADGEIASGGTDFFLAGATRTAEAGARIGVHSWSGMDEEGSEVPKDDPEHTKYLDFYRDMAIPTDFYWYTLDAAPAEGIHWMLPEEIERYEVLTGK